MSLDARITDAVARVFGVNPEVVSADLRIGDVPEWDSLGQLNLIMEVESVFNTRFDGRQLISLTSLADIQNELENRNLLNDN